MQNILFVDDDATIVECYADIFRTLGYDIAVATDARQALDHLNGGKRFSAIVIDLGLPLMSGTELAAEIRRNDPAVRIVIASGHTWDTLPDKERDQIRRLALSFIAKPFSSDELLKLLAFS